MSADAFDALAETIERARNGDRRSEKSLMFAYNYGRTRDPQTGELRAHTPDEIEAARQRILGMKITRTAPNTVRIELDSDPSDK